MREEDPQEWWDVRSEAADRLVDYYLRLRTSGLDEREREHWADEAAFWMDIGMLLEHATNATEASDFRADALVAHVIEDNELSEEGEVGAGDADALAEEAQPTRRTRHMN